MNESTFPAANAGDGRHPHFRLIETPPTPTPTAKETTAQHADTVREQESGCRLTWKDEVGWMLTLACFQWSPWLPFTDHTGPSELVWPFCLRKAFSVPAQRRERSVRTWKPWWWIFTNPSNCGLQKPEGNNRFFYHVRAQWSYLHTVLFGCPDFIENMTPNQSSSHRFSCWSAWNLNQRAAI